MQLPAAGAAAIEAALALGDSVRVVSALQNIGAEKLAAGWTYGPAKDPEAKRHPCLVPFAELPANQQAKDRLFFAVVSALVLP